MDPDAALARIRELASGIITGADSLEMDDYDLSIDGQDLAEAFQGLDEWIMKGGFLPKDWRK